MDDEKQIDENTIDIEALDDEELTVDSDFFDELDNDIDNYYSKLHKNK